MPGEDGTNRSGGVLGGGGKKAKGKGLYLPAHSDNSHRAAECAAAVSTIKDELDEAIVLDRVSLCIADWLPVGSNQILSLGQRLGYVLS